MLKSVLLRACVLCLLAASPPLNAAARYTGLAADRVTRDCQVPTLGAGDCPDEILVTGPFSGVTEFSVPGLPEEIEVSWQFGDGSMLDNATGTVAHTYSQGGVYEVSAAFFFGDCAEGSAAILTTTVQVTFCPQFISQAQIACHTYLFFADIPVNNLLFEWDFGDGDTWDWQGIPAHTFTGSGSHEVCLSVEAGECAGTSLCTVFEVPVCEGGDPGCPEVFAAFDECGEISLEINPYTEGAQLVMPDTSMAVSGPVMSYQVPQDAVPMVFFVDVPGCEPSVFEYAPAYCTCFSGFEVDGTCSPVTISVDVPGESVLHWVVAGYNFYGTASETFEIGQPGLHEVCIHYQHALCEMSQYYCFNILVEVCAAECPDSIDVTPLGDNSFVFYLPGLEDGAVVTWNFGDGTVNAGDDTATHSFLPGNYLVSADFIDADCPGGTTTTLVTEVTAYADCFLELEAVEGEDGSFTFTATGEPVTLPMYWDFGDGTTLEATWVTDHSYAPGEYEVCAWFLNEACADTTRACVSIVLEEPWFCPNTIVISDDCWLSVPGVPAGSGGNWSVTACGNTQQFNDAGAALHVQFTAFCDPLVVCFSSDSLLALGCPEISSDLSAAVNGNCVVNLADLVGHGLMIYPNPALEELWVEFPQAGSWQVVLRDVTGQRLLSAQRYDRRILLDLRALSPALYIIEVSSADQRFVRPLVKK